MIPSGFRRLARREKCRICEHQGWCLASDDGSDRVLCQRRGSPVRWKCGWLHGCASRGRGPSVVQLEERPDFESWERIAQESYSRLRKRSEVLGQLAAGLGVTVESFDALRVGIQGEGRFTWPMRDDRARVIGVRLREHHGRRFAIEGSRNGLFVPIIGERELVLACEGETDTAAALSLGFFAIGRPGCQGGTELFLRWLKRRLGRDVVVIADRDEAGINGAAAFAVAIAPHVRTLRVIVGPRDSKDLRVAVQNGYSSEDLLQDIEAAFHVQSILRVEGEDADGLSLARRLASRLSGGGQ